MNQSSAIRGTIFDIKKFAIHDGAGIRTTVFFKGCPLDCWWCHNPESRSPAIEKLAVTDRRTGNGRDPVARQEVVGRVVTVAEVMAEVEKDRIFYDQSGGGVTLSGGEPMMQPGFAAALLGACRDAGITTILDTSGYAPANEFERISGLADHILFDLKLMDDREHREYTGVSNGPILDNLLQLAEHMRPVTIRVPLIPGITDTEDNLDSMIEFLTSLDNVTRISLLPYNKLAEDKCRRFGMASRLGTLATQTDAELRRIEARFALCGYEVSIGG
jgi:pyruvate formate lyase activating enzyme